MTATEAQEQEAVIQWCDLHDVPCVHVPNERKAPLATIQALKRQGMRPGFPDLIIPVPKGGYGALYIEMKAKGGKVTQRQAEWIKRLRELGNAAYVCIGADSAIKCIALYMAR